MTKNDLKLILIPGNQQLLDNPPTPAYKTTLNSQKPKTLGTYNKAISQKKALSKDKPKLTLVYSKTTTAFFLFIASTIMGFQPAEAQSLFDKIESTPAKGWALTQVEADKARRIARDEKTITVAVIDTGVDVSHPDLKQNLWVNQGEAGVDSRGRDKSKNGIDDDGNGYVDDLHGWNFVNRNNDLTDKIEHGTHIAGIISSSKGVAPSAKLMVLKYYNPKATDRENLENTILAIQYAVKMKANIINYSAGGLEKSAREEQAIREALDNKILFIAAAGNEKNNSDLKGFYPADYDLDNILSVTAVDSDKKVLESSNYGAKSVDIAAPGKNIYSTIPGGKYGFMTGTSQATAFVTGIAALLMASEKHLDTPDKVIRQILASASLENTLVGKTKSQALVNSYRALAIQDQGINAFGDQIENFKYEMPANKSLFYPDRIWNAN